MNVDEFEELSDDVALETLGHELLHVASNSYSNYLRDRTVIRNNEPIK